MSQSIDVYSGWIVAFVDGLWRHVYVPATFCTIADHWEPNQHLGVFRREDVDRAEGTIQGEALETSPHVVIGPQVIDEDVLHRIAYVRFGRDASQIHEERLIDCAFPSVAWSIYQNLDDSKGLDESWPRYPSPAGPERWNRTPRSLDHFLSQGASKDMP